MRDDIQRLALEGRSPAEIARETGASPKTVYRARMRLGCPPAIGRPPGCATLADWCSARAALRLVRHEDKGSPVWVRTRGSRLTTKAAAAAHGIPVGTLFRWIRDGHPEENRGIQDQK